MFTGEYRHSVDDKGRIAVPAKFRAQLDAGAVVSRWLDACLAIHTRAGWDALADKVATLPITDQTARRFERFIFAGAVELDARPPGPRPHPGLPARAWPASTAEAVVVGTRDHAEIWAPDRWEDYRRALEDPTSARRGHRGARDLARTTCASRVRSGSDRSAVEER